MAVACPLLEGIDLSGARGVLVLIAASKQTFKLAKSRNAMNTIPPVCGRRRARDLQAPQGTQALHAGIGGQGAQVHARASAQL